MIVTYIILIANLISGIICLATGNTHIDTGGLNYEYIFNNGEYIRLITYMFLHANVPHFINNMISLYIFGSVIEPKLGSFRVALIYLGSGLGAGMASIYISHMLEPNTIRYAAGASGAIFGVICATVFLSVKGNDEAKRSDLIKAVALMIVYVCISNGVNVDIWGHLGGAVSGGILTMLLSVKDWQYYEESLVNKLAGITVITTLSLIALVRIVTQTEATQLKDSRIDEVKAMQIYTESDITYGTCLDKLNDAKWTVFTATNDMEIVEFTGNTYYDGKYVDVQMQFSRHNKTASWFITYMSHNSRALQKEEIIDFINYLNGY